jgi:hypothetical protein
VIVRDIIPDHAAQKNVIEDDQVIEKLSATAPDPAFRDSILPRACRAYARGFHATGDKQLGYGLAKLANLLIRLQWVEAVSLFLFQAPPADSLFLSVRITVV